MTEPPAFAGWDNFAVIIGSSAGALTGLQFVVMALVAEVRPGGARRTAARSARRRSCTAAPRC